MRPTPAELEESWARVQSIASLLVASPAPTPRKETEGVNRSSRISSERRIGRLVAERRAGSRNSCFQFMMYHSWCKIDGAEKEGQSLSAEHVASVLIERNDREST